MIQKYLKVKAGALIRYATLFVLFFCGTQASAQFWEENFGWGCNRNQNANGVAGSQGGTWTVTDVGTNGAQAHNWYISAAASYDTSQVPLFPQCDQSCATAPTFDNQSLHIAPTPFAIPLPTGGNLNIPGDSAGMAFTGGYCNTLGFCVETNRRAESPVINCTGWQNITVRLNYFEGGTAPDQDAYVAYFDGTTWNNTFFNLTKTQNICTNQGEWSDILINLPASATNNPNVRLGFYWSNSEAATPSAQPLVASFAVDDIKVFGNPFTLVTEANFQVNGSTKVCLGDPVNFNDLSTGADSIEWNFPGGNPATSNASNPSVTYNSTGFYTVSLTVFNTTNGNSDDTTVFNLIEVDSCNEVPLANFMPQDTIICSGDSIQFVDLSTGSPDDWNWFFPGASNITFDSAQVPRFVRYDSAGVYEVTLIVTNTSGLDDSTVTAAVRVEDCFLPDPDFSVADDSICVNGCVTFIDESRYGTSYLWIFEGADSLTDTSFVPNPTVCYDSVGLFDVTLILTNDNGTVTFTETDFISVADTPLVDAGGDIELLAGDFTLLQAQGQGERFFWIELGENPNNLDDSELSLSCRNCDAPTATPEDSTTYVVFNINRHGCFATDTVSVFITQEYYIGVPTAFSPNLDGENDELYVLGNGFFSIEFAIFNRFGQKVFETKDPTTGWDGRFNDELLNPGVYAYYVKVVFENGVEEVLSGNVTLVR